MSFAEQTPLIISGDIRSNITFGLPFDEAHYEAVTEACCLREDFTMLPSGDLTKAGEMGHILSGGQKSRISIARALYRKTSKIILIDGSLSSLDSRVARQVLDNLRTGELTRNKIVFLVTYDQDQATEMDYILHITDKGTVEVLTPTDLQQNNLKIVTSRQETSAEAEEEQKQGTDVL